MVSILGADSSVIAVLPEGGNGVGLNITEAYLLAVAPQLFDVWTKINSILENSYIVTPEGFKINFYEIQKSLSEALLRARGCRKNPEEP